MSKLLFIYERDMPTISIARNVFLNLKSYPTIISDFMYLTEVSKSDIDSHDVIIFLRPDNIYSWKIAQKARVAGHVVVTFCDDDLLNLPKSSPTIPWRKRGLLKTLHNSDVIWSSSRYLLDSYKDYTAGKRTAITDTIVQPEEIEDIQILPKKEQVRIVYAAAPSHAILFETYISPIIPRLVNEFGDRISFTFISVHPEVKDVKCEYVPGMPLLKYRKYMKEQHFDIGVAPLFNDNFSKCKYFNKFLEYTTHGIVGVYSKIEPYTYVIEDTKNGMLVADSPDGWFDALSTLIKNNDLRCKCLENAIDYIRNNHSEETCIEKIRKGIPEILEENHHYKTCKNFAYQKYFSNFTRLFDWIYLFFFYLKHTGIKALVKRIKIHFIEVKAYNRRNNK